MSHVYYDNAAVQGMVVEILRDMHQQQWRPDYVVGLSRGGLIPAVMISHYLNIPMYSLKISLRDATGPESNLWMAEDAYGYVNYDPMTSNDGTKNILVVDDINDSGATFNWLVKDWQSSCQPHDQDRWKSVWNHSVKFAVLVNNVASHFEKKIDYSGQEINKLEESNWIVFPWEQWWNPVKI